MAAPGDARGTGTTGARFAAGLAAGLAAVLGVAAVAAFWGADAVPLHPDDAFYALLADNIRRGGPWLYLHHWWLPDQPYLDKPPLYFWLSAAADRAIGFRPLAFRLWSGLLGCATALVTALLGRALYGPAAGLLAGLLLGTSGSFLFEYGTRNGAPNTGVACCAALMLLAAVAPWGRTHPGRAAALLAAAGGAAGWLKPLNGLILLGLAAAAILCQAPAERRPRLRAAALAAGPVLAANLAWPVLMWAHYGTTFLDHFLRLNIWVRFTRGVDPGHLGPWFAYAKVPAPLLRLGWLAAALRLGWRLARRRGAWGPDAIVCLVPLLLIALLSLSPTKLPQYAFPVLPLLAVAGGALVAQAAGLLPGRRAPAAAAAAAAVYIAVRGLAPVADQIATQRPYPWARAGCPASDPPGRPVAVLLAGLPDLAAVEAGARNRELELELRGLRQRLRVVTPEGLAAAVRQGGPALVFLRRGGAAEAAAGPLAATPPLASFPARYGPPATTDALALGLDPRCR